MIAALVSQARGLAIFDDGKMAAALLDADSEPLVLSERELSRLLRGAADIEALALPGLAELRVALRERRLREQVLHATLLYIDERSSRSLRATAGATLIRLAAPDAIIRWVECVMMSVPAPAEADFTSAGGLPCDDRIAAMLHRIESYQSRIRSVFAAFLAVCRKAGVSNRSPLRRRAVEQGWFRSLVLGERLLLGKADEAWSLIEQWIECLVEMMTSHAVVVHPTAAPMASLKEQGRLEEAGWVIWPLSSEHEPLDLSPRGSARSSQLDVWAAPRDASPLVVEQGPSPRTVRTAILLEDLNLHKAERLLCEVALTRAGSIPEAAQLLGITRYALKRRLVRYRIEWPTAAVKSPLWGAVKVTVDRKAESEDRRLRVRRSAGGRGLKSKTIREA